MRNPIGSLNAALEGRYRVGRVLGEGGMATVYLADDLRHGRNVALKVLRPEVAALVGEERFLAEIRTTARLQHPHILPLFDSGGAGGFLYFVLPFVEGESLADRLDREKQLPVEEAVRITGQVAEALEHAHACGVVHRDVKPGNVLLVGGDAVVADFGVALAVGGVDGRRMTETGVSLGTPVYMSPEQATGSPNVGPASDVWSLGCVLYEMLAGEPPFAASTPQAILGRIVTAPAEAVTERRRATPAHVASAIDKALEKVPSDRFTSAGGFARALSDPAFRHGGPSAGAVGRRRWLAAAVLAAVAYLLGIGTWATVAASRRPADRAPNIRFAIPGLGTIAHSRSIAISRDGAYLAHASGGALQVRRLDDSELSDTLGGPNLVGPFFSPDGESLGYFDGTSANLSRVSRAGGPATVLAVPAGGRPRGAAWGDDGKIVFATTAGLYRVPAVGGDVELLASPDSTRGELAYEWPTILPGGRAVIFTVVTNRTASDRDARIALLDLESREIEPVLEGGSSARYLPSGRLVYRAAPCTR